MYGSHAFLLLRHRDPKAFRLALADSKHTMTNQPSPSPESLALLALGELPEPQRTAMERAVSGSHAASATLARLRDTLDILVDAKLHEPPAATLQATLRLVQAPTAPAQSWLARAADALATLVFDSFSAPAALGLRSAAPADVRHLTFDSDAGEIDVELRHLAHQRVLVTGQVSVQPLHDQLVRVGYSDPDSSGETNADARGRFAFEVAPGQLHIKLQLTSRIIGLPTIVA